MIAAGRRCAKVRVTCARNGRLLQLDDDRLMPLTTALTLVAVAAVASMLPAWLTTLGTTARLDPEHIRAE